MPEEQDSTGTASNPIKSQRITRRMGRILKKRGRQKQVETVCQQCPICLSEIQQSATLPCEHVFCLACLANWWSNSNVCPYCREQFDCLFDARGRKLTIQDISASLLFEQEKTLRCETCWADIGDEPMRICFDCRCVYIHRRCQSIEQSRMRKFLCQECYKTMEEKIFEQNQEMDKQQFLPSKHRMYQGAEKSQIFYSVRGRLL